MVKVNGIYYDGYLKSNLDIALKVIKKDWDMVFVIDGYEGSGKSVLAQQIAFYCDNTLNIDRITFNPDEFMKAVKKAKQYEAVVYDEAMGGLSSKDSLGAVNKALIKMLAEIRQKNLFIFIVMPCFMELSKYAAIWRSRGLCHVYNSDNFERGYFSFYNMKRKKDLYMHGKKFYEYKVPPNFRGRFSKGYAVPEAEYREKKLRSLDSDTFETPNRFQQSRNSLVRVCYEKGLFTYDKLAKAMSKYSDKPFKESSVRMIIKRAKENEI